ncbi:MAG: biotin--[acetyl-CoA-carboxylase] ligase [Balneolaceae bacterium]
MISPFNINQFRDRLRTSWLGSEILYEEKLPSTNSYLKKIPIENITQGMVAITDHQEKGRGQYEKFWEAEPGANLTFTMVFKPKSGGRMSLLTLGCAYAIQKSLQPYIDSTIQIKWPNDLLVNNKKLGGILTECMFLGSAPERVLIGIGLNINQTKFSNLLKNSATSIAIESKSTHSREIILADLLSQIEHMYTRWLKNDPTLQKDISREIIGYGDWINLSINGTESSKKHKFLGVDEKGCCLMLNDELDVNTFSHEQIRIITDRAAV